MSSIDRPLSGDVLWFHLEDEREFVRDSALLERHGRNARTLLKEGPLRVTLIMLAPGGRIPTHRAGGAMTLQVLDGNIQFRAQGKDHRLVCGDMLVADGEVDHEVASEDGGTFLLTIVHATAERTPG
jgi:quercetin dioxygenase-like cupin family protein